MSVRVYPIRFSRKSWHIGLYTKHNCTTQPCNYTFIKNKYNKKLKMVHTDGNTCERSNNIENTLVSVKYFDIRNPHGIFGPLYQASNIVIPKNTFTMILDYPLRQKLKVHVTEPLDDKGFTLKEVLYAIRLSYEDIYELEEETSTPEQYIIVTECDECNSINLKQKISFGQNNQDHVCPICFENTKNKEITQLENCSHCFHKECIEKWIDHDGKKCPICREHLAHCSSCDGEGNKTIFYTGVVLPLEYRGTAYRRETDGLYGIYDYYLEDLYVYSLRYDNQTNELFVSVQT